MARTRVILEFWLLDKPKLSLHEYWKHVFRINGPGLTEFIVFLGKPKVNGLGDKFGSVYKGCAHVKELIT